MKFSPMKCHVGSEEDLKKAGWIYEPKVDGIRALCYVTAKGMNYISRAGNDLTERFPELAVRDAVKAKSCVLDGEIVGYDKKGIPSFGALQDGAQAHFIVFDIVELNGKSLVKKTLLERKQLLDEVLHPKDTIEKIVFTSNGPQLWRIMKQKHMEGVVAKDALSSYYSGKRSSLWLKIKFVNTIDCIIVGYTQEKRTISSLALALYNKEGKLQYIGKTGTGFNEVSIKALSQLLEPIKTATLPIEASPIELPEHIQWVKPKYVCEVKFQRFTQYAILRISAFLRIRHDKKPRECTFKAQV